MPLKINTKKVAAIHISEQTTQAATEASTNGFKQALNTLSTHIQDCTKDCLPSAFRRMSLRKRRSSISSSTDNQDSAKVKAMLSPLNERVSVAPPLYQMDAAAVALPTSNGLAYAAACAVKTNITTTSSKRTNPGSCSEVHIGDQSKATTRVSLAETKSIPPSERPAGYWESTENSKPKSGPWSKYNNTAWETGTALDEGFTGKPTTSNKRKLDDATSKSKLPTSESQKTWLEKMASNTSDMSSDEESESEDDNQDDSSLSSIDSEGSDILVNPSTKPTDAKDVNESSTPATSTSSSTHTPPLPRYLTLPSPNTSTTTTEEDDPTNSKSAWFHPCSPSDILASPHLINDTPSNPTLLPEWRITHKDNYTYTYSPTTATFIKKPKYNDNIFQPIYCEPAFSPRAAMRMERKQRTTGTGKTKRKDINKRRRTMERNPSDSANGGFLYGAGG